MTELNIVHEVPDALTRLVRCVVSGFCSVECALVMDLLIHHPGIKEDDLLDLIKLDRKQLRSVINTLKQDQFINGRIQMETGPDGKATRHNYYFINYSIFVNVVKYKLDQVRRKIEAMERDMTIRASFKCPRCFKTFTDLETGQLFNYSTQTYNCTYCLTEVEEQISEKKNIDSRTLMAKFNEQMEPFYGMLRELDGIKLSDALLDPPLIKDAKNIRSSSSKNNSDKTTWSGDATKYSSGFGAYDKEILISHKNDEPEQAKRSVETPAWIKSSTVDTSSYATNNNNLPKPDQPSSSSSVKMETSSNKDSTNAMINDDIMKTLLSHEKSAIDGNADKYSHGEHKSTLPNQSTNGDDQEMDSEDEDAEFLVTINGNRVHYNDVTPQMVESMSSFEKEEYIRIGKEMHDYYE